MLAAKSIYNITPFTFLDYPDKTACILWFAGCNMKCLYCYNPEIVRGKGSIDFEKAIKFLESRKGLLDGVVLSGGECTMHQSIIPIIREIKKMDFLVKIDTNGSRPDVLKNLLDEKLIDYIALDFKAPSEKFEKITKSKLFDSFEQSLDLLIKSSVPFEVRTTYHSELLDEYDFIAMMAYLENRGYKNKFYIQQFINDIPTLGNLTQSDYNLDKKLFQNTKIQVVYRN